MQVSQLRWTKLSGWQRPPDAAARADLVLGCGIYKQRAAQMDAQLLDLPLESIRSEQRSRLVQLGTT